MDNNAIIEAYEYCRTHGQRGAAAVAAICNKLGYRYYSDYAYVYRIVNNYRNTKNEPRAYRELNTSIDNIHSG